MCGIVGMSAYRVVDRQALEAALSAIEHRGPDGRGISVSDCGRIGFGHARLAIIDLSPTGHQPMHSADGALTITYNGEIYNFAELRDELKTLGFRFRGSSDTEVLLHGYQAFGEEVLGRLNGIFAFAIHDKRKNELFLARDPMGVKPLYYSEGPPGFAFCSEIKGLLHLAGIERRVDAAALRKHLTFLWCPGESTAMQGVSKLAPASALVVRDGAIVRKWVYWKQPEYAPRRDWSRAQCAQELHAVLERCVRRQMVSDAPLGAFLSGGIDSSSIVAIARRSMPDIKCFTIGVDGGSEAGVTDDLPYAQRVAAELEVALETVYVDADAIRKKIEDMVFMLDEPIADPASLNLFFICQLAREKDIKVLLSGTGGDDVFAGYRRHMFARNSALFSLLLPGSVRERLLHRLDPDQRNPWLRKAVKSLRTLSGDADDRLVTSFVWSPGLDVDELFSAEVRQQALAEDPAAPLYQILEEKPDLPDLEKVLRLEKRFFLGDHNLTYTDKMSMATGVEVRVPFLDLEMLEFASRVPYDWKHTLRSAKSILKQAERAHLPQDVLRRPKSGFGVPLRRWLTHDSRDQVEEVLSKRSLEERGLFDAAAVRRLIQANLDGRVDASYTVFALMCIEMWCREFVDWRGRRAGRDAPGFQKQ